MLPEANCAESTEMPGVPAPVSPLGPLGPVGPVGPGSPFDVHPNPTSPATSTTAIRSIMTWPPEADGDGSSATDAPYRILIKSRTNFSPKSALVGRARYTASVVACPSGLLGYMDSRGNTRCDVS